MMMLYNFLFVILNAMMRYPKAMVGLVALCVGVYLLYYVGRWMVKTARTVFGILALSYQRVHAMGKATMAASIVAYNYATTLQNAIGTTFHKIVHVYNTLAVLVEKTMTILYFVLICLLGLGFLLLVPFTAILWASNQLGYPLHDYKLTVLKVLSLGLLWLGNRMTTAWRTAPAATPVCHAKVTTPMIGHDDDLEEKSVAESFVDAAHWMDPLVIGAVTTDNDQGNDEKDSFVDDAAHWMVPLTTTDEEVSEESPNIEQASEEQDDDDADFWATPLPQPVSSSSKSTPSSSATKKSSRAQQRQEACRRAQQWAEEEKKKDSSSCATKTKSSNNKRSSTASKRTKSSSSKRSTAIPSTTTSKRTTRNSTRRS
jgi:hypothetical protein